jgi:hypothetical protein
MLFQISNKHHHYHNINSQAIFFFAFCGLGEKYKMHITVIQLGTGLRTFTHPISQIVLKKISLIIKECPEEILIKLELS